MGYIHPIGSTYVVCRGEWVTSILLGRLMSSVGVNGLMINIYLLRNSEAFVRVRVPTI